MKAKGERVMWGNKWRVSVGLGFLIADKVSLMVL